MPTVRYQIAEAHFRTKLYERPLAPSSLMETRAPHRGARFAPLQAAVLTSIFFATAAAGLGTFTVRTPLVMVALILSGSMLAGSSTERVNEP